ncbi:MAG: HIT family protein [Myxococcaceae bacterium]
MSSFALEARLAADTAPIAESELSLLLLYDDARYPWCVLVPRRPAVIELHHLSDVDRRTLSDEAAIVAGALENLFHPEKINVGALGNVVRQLHLHVIARQIGDPAWPGPAWGHSQRVPRSPKERAELIARLRAHPAIGAWFS